MYPMKLKPVCKDYIWGGTKLKTEYGKDSDNERIAESWELSCHKDGESVIVNGEYAGTTLSDYIKLKGSSVLGNNCSKFKYFPVLIKLIDACDKLSVQVHPDDAYALETEGEYGKTEMWYVIDCEPDAELIYGFKREVTKEELSERIKNNTLTEVVNNVKVKKGDMFFIEAGTLHAIGAGILIAEIQQNSNSTYRVYDYGRTDANGNPRELHVEKALETVSLTAQKSAAMTLTAEKRGGYTVTPLTRCKYFCVDKLDIEKNAETVLSASADSFNSLLVLEGECEAGGLRLKKGETCFIPAGTGKYTVNGKCVVILTSITK